MAGPSGRRGPVRGARALLAESPGGGRRHGRLTESKGPMTLGQGVVLGPIALTEATPLTLEVTKDPTSPRGVVRRMGADETRAEAWSTVASTVCTPERNVTSTEPATLVPPDRTVAHHRPALQDTLP